MDEEIRFKESLASFNSMLELENRPPEHDSRFYFIFQKCVFHKNGLMRSSRKKRTQYFPNVFDCITLTRWCFGSLRSNT
jgi:hypothetical protein